jgi:hypothetical protein
MTRKFKFVGYGDKQAYQDEFGGDYDDMPRDKYRWYDSPDFTVGKVYEPLSEVCEYEGDYPPDAWFDDDTGIAQCQELQFFEEVFE